MHDSLSMWENTRYVWRYTKTCEDTREDTRELVKIHAMVHVLSDKVRVDCTCGFGIHVHLQVRGGLSP